MRISLLCLLLSVFLISCNHTIAIRRAHFLTPTVADEQWGGKLMFVVHNPARIELIEDYTTNPPVRNEIQINESSAEVADLLGINNMSFDLNLNIYKSLEIITEGSNTGVKWQFLNHASKADAWVASILLARGSFNETSAKGEEANIESADSNIESKLLGLSIGFVSKHATPYISVVYQDIEASTSIINDHGNFGPYKDKGIHTSYALGIDFQKSFFSAGIEYNFTHIKWANQTDNQEDLALRMGFNW